MHNHPSMGHGLMWRLIHAYVTVNDAENTHIEGMMGLNHGRTDSGGYFTNVANSKNVYVKNLKLIRSYK